MRHLSHSTTITCRGQPPIDRRRDAPRLDPVLARNLRHQMRRNEFTDLTENGTPTPGCRDWHRTTSFGLVAKKACSRSVSHYNFPHSGVGR